MNTHLKKIVLFSAILTGINAVTSAQELSKYIQPFSGTAAATTPAALKHGEGFSLYANTIPAVTLPFAMTQWTPQTQITENKCVPPYYYKDDSFSGLRGSHWLSGSCTQDYGSFTVMPISGQLHTDPAVYAAKFSHDDETSSAYQYSIDLKKYNITAAVTSTLRGAIMQFTAQKADSVYLLITPNSDYKEGYVKVDAANGEVSGYNPVHRIYQGWGKKAGFNGYFVIKVERVIQRSGTFVGGAHSNAATIQDQGGAGAYLGFKLKKGEVLRIRIGTSFSSIDGARKNLEAEVPDFAFETLAAKSKSTWEKVLSSVTLKSNDEKSKRIFYTALYHSMQQPRLYNDIDGVYPAFASENKLSKLQKGDYYDDFSLWDTYRAHLPLFEILQPEVAANVANSLVIKGQEGGWLPIFPCWNSYTSEMIGDHCSSVLASAYLKGIGDFNINEAYRLMRQNAFDIPATREEYVEGKGRRALDTYLKYGYIPVEDSVADAFHKKEQVSRTLEYAYDDYALAMVARKMGKTSDYNQLIKRAGYYSNVFDKSVGMVRGRHENGSWVSPFNKDGKEYYITEGTPRQYTFYVPQDVPGLAKLMGGKVKLERALDSIFIKNEYWHGNEPGHQTPFMYNYTAAPWKGQREVRQILATEYSDGPGGLSGNDDAGQMSAWYMFAAMGFYPLNPVSGEYLLCSPIFDEVKLNLPTGKVFEIITHKSSSDAQYITAVKMNGKVYPYNYIRYTDVIKGGKLEFYLQSAPDKKWGGASSAQPIGMVK